MSLVYSVKNLSSVISLFLPPSSCHPPAWLECITIIIDCGTRPGYLPKHSLPLMSPSLLNTFCCFAHKRRGIVRDTGRWLASWLAGWTDGQTDTQGGRGQLTASWLHAGHNQPPGRRAACCGGWWVPWYDVHLPLSSPARAPLMASRASLDLAVYSCRSRTKQTRQASDPRPPSLSRRRIGDFLKGHLGRWLIELAGGNHAEEWLQHCDWDIQFLVFVLFVFFKSNFVVIDEKTYTLTWLVEHKCVLRHFFF